MPPRSEAGGQLSGFAAERAEFAGGDALSHDASRCHAWALVKRLRAIRSLRQIDALIQADAIEWSSTGVAPYVPTVELVPSVPIC